ncbi:MAG: isocitrate/isopropylmalate dehydrogenase family protein [Nitriliruptorales bacterium]|nr:isocitrate/isopropylmalate dehydrogenase family protein [Nitriliruptorales bacterium]
MTDARPYRLGVLDGDGIGPEIVPASLDVLDAVLAATGRAGGIEWMRLPMGRSAIDEHGAAMPDETLHALATLDGWIMGPHDSASYPEPHRSQLNPSGLVRKKFDLFANIRPAKTFPGTRAVCANADLVIVRENTQGFYADRNTYLGTGEWMPTADVAIAQAIFTRPAIERIARQAFELARRRRKHLTIVHKANVLRVTTGMFRSIVEEFAPEYPDVTVDAFHMDAMTVHLVRRAGDFDVIVAENMFGDILSDLAGEVSGSLGVAASLNHSTDKAMAQAAHGSAPDIAGQGVANPAAMILSAAMLLGWLGARNDDMALPRAAAEIERGVSAAIAGGSATRDLGGSASTAGFVAAVVAELGS